MAWDDGLKDSHREFVVQYLVDFNGTQAAMRAGYSEKGARVQAVRLLTNVNIQKAIAEYRKYLQEETGVSLENTIREYAKIAFFNPKRLVDNQGNLIPLQDLPDEVAAAVEKIKSSSYVDPKSLAEEGEIRNEIYKEYQLHDKLKALQDIGRHLGMFNDKSTVNVTGVESLLASIAKSGTRPQDMIVEDD